MHTWFDRLMALCHCGCLHGGETQVHIIQRHILGRHVPIGFLLSCNFSFVCKAVRQSTERNTWGSKLILLHLCILAKSKQCHHLYPYANSRIQLPHDKASSLSEALVSISTLQNFFTRFVGVGRDLHFPFPVCGLQLWKLFPYLYISIKVMSQLCL